MQTTAVPCALAAALACSISAHAEIVHVHITGSVESNQFVTGLLAGIPANAPVDLRFDVDSAVFINSPTPSLANRVRGYRVINSTFVLTIGGRNVPLQGAPAWNFVIRNNDPGVDGFFFSAGTDVPTQIPVAINVAGYGVEYSRTFNSAATLPSLNILDAQGSWAFNNLSVYNFNIARGELSVPCIMTPETITIAVEAPPCLADYNQDRGVDGDDVIAFFADWNLSLPAADINGDGGTDGDDTIDFFALWDAGC
ncbi:MAG: GC-type dockerin domain-anchored protein [Phycisphaerales bacterium]